MTAAPFDSPPCLPSLSSRTHTAPVHVSRQGDETSDLDVQLIRQMADGNESAMAMFYDRHSACLYGLALKILRDEYDAQDVLQDSLVTVWKKSETFDPRLCSPLGWATMILRNKAIDYLRSRERRQKRLERAKAEFWISDDMDDGSAGEPVRREHRNLVRQALTKLRPEQRRMLDLAFFSGLSHAEISERLRAPLGTVKTVIRRSLIELRSQLQLAF